MTETRVVLRDFAADVDVALVNPETAIIRRTRIDVGCRAAGSDAMSLGRPAALGWHRPSDPRPTASAGSRR